MKNDWTIQKILELVMVLTLIVFVVTTIIHNSKQEEKENDKIVEKVSDAKNDTVKVTYLGRDCRDTLCLYFYEINGKVYAATYNGGLIELQRDEQN